MPTLPTDRHVARARYLGADAALACAAALVPTLAEAARTLTGDITWADPPDLTGATPDDTTPELLLTDVLALDSQARDEGTHAMATTEALAAAWHAGRDLLWAPALLAVALRATGDITAALAVENRNEQSATRLREQAR